MSTYAIRDAALAGRPLNEVRIIDGHGHLDLWKSNCFPERSDIESIIVSMDRIGIDTVCLNKWNCPDARQANDDVGSAIKRFPGRVIGFATTSPCLGRDAMTAELTRCFGELGFSGIKVHDGYQHLPMRDRRPLPVFTDALEAIWEFADAHACPVLCHGSLTPDIAQRYRQARFLAAHAGGNRASAHIFADCPNVFLDTAASGTLRGNIRYLVEHVGAERVVYGSDLPYADPAYRIGQVIGTDLTDDELTLILGGNMARLLKLDGPS